MKETVAVCGHSECFSGGVLRGGGAREFSGGAEKVTEKLLSARQKVASVRFSGS